MSVQAVFTHPWYVSPAEAREIQRRLRDRVLVQPLDHQPEIIAGIDVSVKGERARAAAVLLSYPDLTPFHAVTAEVDLVLSAKICVNLRPITCRFEAKIR